MLPFTKGADRVFRQILVPLFNMRADLIKKDAALLVMPVSLAVFHWSYPFVAASSFEAFSLDCMRRDRTAGANVTAQVSWVQAPFSPPPPSPPPSPPPASPRVQSSPLHALHRHSSSLGPSKR